MKGKVKGKKGQRTNQENKVKTRVIDFAEQGQKYGYVVANNRNNNE